MYLHIHFFNLITVPSVFLSGCQRLLLPQSDNLHKVTRQYDVLYINSLSKQGRNLFFVETSYAATNLSDKETQF